MPESLRWGHGGPLSPNLPKGSAVGPVRPALATRWWSSKATWMWSGGSGDSICWVLLVSGWFSSSKTIIPEAWSTFSPLQPESTLVISVDSDLASPWWHSLPWGWNRACSTSGAAAHGCWQLGFGQEWMATRGSPQPALRKPVCAGTATAVVVAVFVNRRVGQLSVTRSVGKPAPVASEFDWIPSPCSDDFRFGV